MGHSVCVDLLPPVERVLCLSRPVHVEALCSSAVVDSNRAYLLEYFITVLFWVSLLYLRVFFWKVMTFTPLHFKDKPVLSTPLHFKEARHYLFLSGSTQLCILPYVVTIRVTSFCKSSGKKTYSNVLTFKSTLYFWIPEYF